jgi:hypothetical protein
MSKTFADRQAAVGIHNHDFDQLSDDDVRLLSGTDVHWSADDCTSAGAASKGALAQ